MATLYVDFENGNDNNAGSSFSVLATGTGTGSAGTLTDTSANFPNDGSLINQYLALPNIADLPSVYRITGWLSSTQLSYTGIPGGPSGNSIHNGTYTIGGRWKSLTNGAIAARIAPGDEIRIMGSPAPTSLGQNGVWTSEVLQGTKNISSSTNATPIVITCNSHGYATGDTVVITGHSINTNANGTWEITVTGANTFSLDGSVGNGVGGSSGNVRLRNNTRVMLTTPVTQNIASTGPGRTAWTSSANVTAAFDASNFKEHNRADSITIAAGFTTGLAAYWPLPSTLDLSGYQQVSFWIRQSSGTVGAAGAIDLRLCSDNAGVTAVNTINFPNLAGTGRWMPVTVDLGTDLGSSIQSIALYVNTDNGAQTFQLNNIIACKASSAPDSLTLTSLIGKNTPGETFWGIQSINGTRVMLDADTNTSPISTNLRGYYGTSETVTTYKRETIKLGPAASSSTLLERILDNGAFESPITFSGGWDRTAMSTQNLETWLDGVNGNGIALFGGPTRRWISVSKLAFTRFTQAVDAGSGNNHTYSIIAANNCTSGAFTGVISQNQSTPCLFDVDFIVASPSLGFRFTQNNCNLRLGYLIGSCNIGLATNNPGLFSLIPLYATSPKIANCGGGISDSPGVTVNNTVLQDNSTNDVSFGGGNVVLIKCLLGSKVTATSAIWVSGQVFSQNHDQTANNHKIFMDGALISSAIDQRHTASGISWKIQPTTTDRFSSRPVVLSLAKVACAANALVTIKAWMRRSHTDLTMRLVCKGDQLAGIPSDVVDSMTAAADTWAEQTITFTPTEAGVVEITAEAWGGTTFSGWVDDLTISQA